MNDAGLQRRRGEHRAQSLGHAFKSIGDDNLDVIDSARLQVLEDLYRELGPFGVLDLQRPRMSRP